MKLLPPIFHLMLLSSYRPIRCSFPENAFATFFS